MKCEHCGRRNHQKGDCYYYKQVLTKQEQNPGDKQPPQSKLANTDHFAFMMTGCDENLQNDTPTSVVFILDSGATDHMVNRDDVFTSWSVLSPPLQVAVAKTGEFMTATKRGLIQVTTTLGFTGTLQDVLFTPQATTNLLSIRRIQESGMKVVFDQGVQVQDKTGKTILKGKTYNGLFGVKFRISKNMTESGSTLLVRNSDNFRLWHERLGHISNGKFQQLKRCQMAGNMSDLNKIMPTNDLCEACLYGKEARLPFNKNKNKSHVKRPLYIVHSDICGPITPSTLSCQNYFASFIDDYTHYTVTYLLTYKSELCKVFKDFVAKSETHFSLKLENLYCDNGGEYLPNEVKEFCLEKEIAFHLTVPHTPQQNGVAERMNRTITEKVRSMLSSADLDKSFWGEAVQTATYLINRTPTKALNTNKTPHEMWHNRKPQLNHLKVFGSTANNHFKTINQ
ncbi:hypothetical protein Zmor_028042 [Zophobas morio]|uniref:Integrase catalytic domain-containing protein n=1 Tax=Zophobas morio TaxID=2755281 RepID=A0AA38HQ60_9CUCU|nr:hypothetical protein Zmor_028042 [Zophobas morio]